jgi:hypothetical protein
MTENIDTFSIETLPVWLIIPIAFFLIGGGLIILIVTLT